MAVVADRDEPGQLVTGQRHVVDMAACQIAAQPHLVVFGQEGRCAFGRRLVQDELEREAAQHGGHGRCEDRNIGGNERANVHGVY